MLGRPEPAWVTDTSVYTHLWRAGHGDLLAHVARTEGLILVPQDVDEEIREGRRRYPAIPDVASVGWASRVSLTEEEEFTMLLVKGEMSGAPDQHLGECAVVAVVRHRNLKGLIDERAAIAVAERFGVVTRDTLWVVVEEYCGMPGFGRDEAERAVDDLIATGMRLPVADGVELFSWAYRQGYLPRI